MNAMRRVRGLLPLLEWIHPWIVKTGTDLLDPVARAEAPVLAAWPTVRLAGPLGRAGAGLGRGGAGGCPGAGDGGRGGPRGGRHRERASWCASSTAPRRFRHLRIENSAHIMPRDRNGPLVAAELTAFLARAFTPGKG